MKKPTNNFGDYTKERRNNFDFLRFVAASLVVYSHSFTLAAGTADPFSIWTHNQLTFGGLAVRVFFVISGFLITASFERSNDIIKFTRARALRIFPGLVAVVVFVAIIVGPITTNLPLHDYFASKSTYSYLLNLTSRGHDSLPGVFKDNVFPVSVNGSLWTLFYEICCYGLVGLLGVAKLLRKPVTIILLLAAMFVPITTRIPHHNFLSAMQSLFLPFAGGMCCYKFRDQLPMRWYLLAISILCLIIAALTGMFLQIIAVFGSYVIFYIAFSPSIRLNSFARRGDISYGLYIYAFPIQQTIVHYFGGKMSVPVLFVMAYPLSILFALLSWNLVEKRFIKLKSRSSVHKAHCS